MDVSASVAPTPSPPKTSTEKATPFTNVSFGKSSKLAALEASGATGYVLVASPTVGSFRRNRTVKGKRQPPIFKEGDIIKEGQVIGYLDQFGTELPVKSDVAGEVLKLLFDDGGTDMLNFRINYSNDATLLKEGTIMEKVLYSHEPYVANAFGCCWLWRPSYCRLAIISWHQPVNFLSCLRIVELLMESSETNRGNPTTGISNEVPIPGRQSRAGSIDRNRADDLHIQPGSKDNPAKHEESIETCESVDRPGASKPPQAKSQRINTKWVFITKAGIIMGPSVLGMNKTYMEKIFPDKEMVVYNTMAKIGIGYFIFITAVKMDAARSLIATRTTRLISSLCFFMRIALTGIFASGVQQYTKGIVPGTGTAVVTDALSITFFAVTAEAMKDHDLLTSELGQLAMSCAMLVEMTCWVLIVSTTLIFQLSFFDSIRVVLVIVVLSLIGIYIIRPAILQFIKKTPEGTPISENLVIAIFVGASVMGVIADAACGSLFPGVLVMGLVIPDGPPLGAAIVEKSELMVMELFMPAFFVVIGQGRCVFSIPHQG
ncbi:hypothetical protein GH714_037458 [Hevea brasiliensis]|uniref:Lipoyl-binding domain-containing protein n=1 Tax=Hevea brasiliensis TaxID=3981 RepID=A0A6A6L5R3_HEVBR|nr:hypothetical protein GH714_037458 [Hevea brasiliensis]